MQPARKLLSLLVLLVMGTELTQVRVTNAIFLCQGHREPGKVGELSPGLGLRRGLECRPAPGLREGCRMIETGFPQLCIRGLQHPLSQDHLPTPEKFRGQTGGFLSWVCHLVGNTEATAEPLGILASGGT
jgi:hypothetical protein